MRTRSIVIGAIALGFTVLVSGAVIGEAPKCTRALLRGGSLPNLQTVVPKHLAIQNEHQRELLRFTNGIANQRGMGDWRIKPDPSPGPGVTITNAVQQILDESLNPENPVCQKVVGTFEFHPEHNHWHVGDVALFEVRVAQVGDDGRGGLWGATLKNDQRQAQSIKATFCLIDWYQLDANAPTTARTYFDCAPLPQGISPGWVDQYHQALDGQEIDITGAPPGVYYLVSTANPDGNFLETNLKDNTAWVGFWLTRDSQGNPKITVTGQSPCGDLKGGMCGGQATNR